MAEDSIIRLRARAEPIDPIDLFAQISRALDVVYEEARQLTSSVQHQVSRVNAFTEFLMSQLGFSGITFVIKRLFYDMHQIEKYRTLYPIVANAVSGFLKYYAKASREKLSDTCMGSLPEDLSAAVWGADSLLVDCLSTTRRINKLHLIEGPPYWPAMRLMEMLRKRKVKVKHIRLYPYHSLKEALNGVEYTLLSFHSVSGSIEKGPLGLGISGSMPVALLASERSDVNLLGVTLAGLIYLDNYLTPRDIPRRQVEHRRLKMVTDEPIYEFVPLSLTNVIVTDFGELKPERHTLDVITRRFVVWSLEWVKNHIKSRYEID